VASLPAQSWMPRLVALGLATLLALGAVEVVLRYRFPIRGVLLRASPVFLHEYVPDSRKVYRHPAADGGSLVLVTINHEGRRGPAAAPKDVPRIVVYGDSFIAAEYSRWEDTLPAQLERELSARRSTPVQGINAGVTGYGPDQAMLRLETDLPVLRPGVIVFAIYAGNDFGDLARNKLFALDADGGLRGRRPFLAPALVEAFEAERAWPSWQIARAVKSVWERRTAGSSSLLEPASADGVPEAAGLTRFDKWLGQGRQEYDEAVAGDDQVRNLLADGYDAVVSLTPQSIAAEYETRLMRAVLARAQADAARAGVPLLVLIIPSPYDAVPDYPLKPDRSTYPAYRPETLTQLVEAMARDLQLPHLNLFDAFSGPDAGRLFFSTGNDHWNAEGERRAAALVAQDIERRGWLR
jgi:lysophospholipase L1-like esterase